MSEVAQKIIFDTDTGDAGLGDAEENLLWKPQNIQVFRINVKFIK